MLMKKTLGRADYIGRWYLVVTIANLSKEVVSILAKIRVMRTQAHWSPATQTKREHPVASMSQGANKQKEVEFPEQSMMDGREEKLHESGRWDQLITAWRSHGRQGPAHNSLEIIEGTFHIHGKVIWNFEQRKDVTLVIFFKCDSGCSVENGC